MKHTTQSSIRKIAKISLVFIMLFGIISSTFPHATSTSSDTSSLPFTDVSPTDWFYEQVHDMFAQGLMIGTTDETFSPHQHVTRAMAVQVLYNHSGQMSVEGITHQFIDVAEDAWYHDAVTWAWTMGIVRGFGDDTFAPNANITRAHLVLLLDNYIIVASLRLPSQRESQMFTDQMDIRNYAKEAIDRFFRAMVINGRPNGTFDPQGNATRAELATMLSQFIKYSEHCDIMAPVPPYGVPAPDPCPTPEYGFPYFD